MESFFQRPLFVSNLSWAKGIDAQGRPIRSGLGPTAEGTRMCPGFAGSTNWFAPSYNESTHFVYFSCAGRMPDVFLQAAKV